MLSEICCALDDKNTTTHYNILSTYTEYNTNSFNARAQFLCSSDPFDRAQMLQ